jgi:hypothetical protein
MLYTLLAVTSRRIYSVTGVVNAWSHTYTLYKDNTLLALQLMPLRKHNMLLLCCSDTKSLLQCSWFT